MLFNTPYYRTLTPIHTIGYDEEADFNYGPYNIFCMETRLYPKVYDIFGRDIMIIFQSVHEDHRMNLKIKLVRITNSYSGVVPNQDLDINEDQKIIIQDSIDRIVSVNPEYCLIDKEELYIAGGGLYPKAWYNEVLGYIDINKDDREYESFGDYPKDYNPFITEDGIYLMFNPVSNYKTAYNEVVGKVLNMLEKYYREGVVYGASNIAYDWKLERMDEDEVVPKLYKPTWTDNRFAPNLSEFLKGRINGETFINIKVSNNLVARHYISLELSKDKINMVFDGNYIKIPVKDLDEAQYVTSLVVSGQSKANGKVVTCALNKMELIYKYIDAANELLYNPSVAGYQTTDPEKPFMFSCSIDRNLSTASVLTELNKMVWSALAEVNTKTTKK